MDTILNTKKERKESASTFHRPAGSIELHLIESADPLQVTLVTPIYTTLFWKPFLGGLSYSLWETLRAYAVLSSRHGRAAPTINELVAALGYGTRHTLLGRNATGKNPARPGTIKVLTDQGICVVTEFGKGRQKYYNFSVADTLPMLDHSQVATLDPHLQEAHYEYVSQRLHLADTFFQSS